MCTLFGGECYYIRFHRNHQTRNTPQSILMFSCIGVTMSERTKQISVAVEQELALRFGIWCKINDMTQTQGLEKLILEHVPNPFIKLQQE